jgi:Histidine kinase-like ATPase domain
MTSHPLRLAVRAASGTGHCWLAPAVEMAATATGNWPLSPEPGPLGWTCFPRVATRTPGMDARAVRAARDFTIATVQRWGAAQRCEDITIVVSELVTNALRHALPDSSETWPRSPIRLGLLQPGPCVLCAVADPSHAAPVPKHLGPLAETGRGLHVIGALADTWGCTTPSDMGKIVWAIFSTDGAPSRLGPRPRPRASWHQHAATAEAAGRPSTALEQC